MMAANINNRWDAAYLLFLDQILRGVVPEKLDQVFMSLFNVKPVYRAFVEELLRQRDVAAGVAYAKKRLQIGPLPEIGEEALAQAIKHFFEQRIVELRGQRDDLDEEIALMTARAGISIEEKR